MIHILIKLINQLLYYLSHLMNIMNYTQIDVIYLLFYYISNTNSLVIALDNGDISPISLFFRIKKAKE